MERRVWPVAYEVAPMVQELLAAAKAPEQALYWTKGPTEVLAAY